jgi:hypothetical protein
MPTLGRVDQRGLRCVFLDLFGRTPLASERVAWAGEERCKLVDWALASREFWKHWLEEQLYYFLLIDNFRPTTESIQALPAQLATGRIGVLDALHRICLSASFDRRNPGPDTFVTVVMEQLLGINVQRHPRELEIGKKVYDGARGSFLGHVGCSQADVIHIAIQDRRAIYHLLRREYERWMRQEPSERDLGEWSTTMERDSLAMPSILRAWFQSAAYDARLEARIAQPNRIFISALYVDLFDRPPSEADKERLSRALDGLANSGPLRSLVARLILDSGQVPLPDRASMNDTSAWIGALFERLLGRPPLAAEHSAFVEAFQDPACRPETVVYAIVSHPEYQTW